MTSSCTSPGPGHLVPVPPLEVGLHPHVVGPAGAGAQPQLGRRLEQLADEGGGLPGGGGGEVEGDGGVHAGRQGGAGWLEEGDFIKQRTRPQ